jgi:hypothetical protein
VYHGVASLLIRDSGCDFFHATLNVFYSRMQVSKKFVLCSRQVFDALTLLVKLNKHSLLPRRSNGR